MTRNLSILIGLMLLIAVYTGYDNRDRHQPSSEPQQTQQKSEPPDTQAAPDFSVGKHRLSDFKDRIIVLNFWASWCAPCVQEFPAMLRLAKDLPDVMFVFISLDENEEAMLRFLKKMKIEGDNVLIGRDTDQSISQKLYQTYKLPETYLIAPGMQISDKIVGGKEDWDSQEMRKKIRDIKSASD